GQGYPSYQVKAEPLSATQTRVILSQTTSHSSVSFFEMPVTLRLTGASGQSETVVLQHTQNNQQFLVDTNVGTVNIVQVNPFQDIISKNNTVEITDTASASVNQIRIFPNPSKD